MQYLERFYGIPKNLHTLTILTKLLYRCAVASHNNKSHCFSAQNSSQDYFGCRRVKIFWFPKNLSVYQAKSNLKVIHFMV